MHANVLPFYTPLTPVWRQKLKKTSEEDYVAYNNIQLKCLSLCTPLSFWVREKGQTLKMCGQV